MFSKCGHLPQDISNNIFAKSSSLNTGIEVKLDYRDDIFTPQSGLYFFSRYKYRTKSFDKIESNNFLVSIPKSSFENIDRLIESNYNAGIIISNDLRKKLLSMIILFYQIHFDQLKEIKSYKVLMEVFGK